MVWLSINCFIMLNHYYLLNLILNIRAANNLEKCKCLHLHSIETIPRAHYQTPLITKLIK